MTLPTVVLAGGVGTRISALTGGRIPKVLVDVAGRTFLDRKLDQLADQGVTDVFLLVGHHGDQVAGYLAEGPTRRLQVSCIDDGPNLLGTGGAIVAALERLPDTFFVTYGDTLLDQPMKPVEEAFDECGRPALMTVIHNADRGQPSNTSIAGRLVVAYSKGEPPGTHAYLDYGLLVFRRSAFDAFLAGQQADLGVIVESLVADGLMAAMVVDKEFHEVGTPEALAETASRYSADTGP